MTNLSSVCDEMRKVAEENIFAPGMKAGQMQLVSEKTHKDIDYEGYKVGLTFSLDEMMGHHFWHLTIGIDGQNLPPTDEFLRPFLQTFFGEDPIMEIPSDMFPPPLRHLRQFVSKK